MPAASRQPALWVLTRQTVGGPVAAASMAAVSERRELDLGRERGAFAAIDPAKKKVGSPGGGACLAPPLTYKGR